jgi:EAL domain-containing protein (putative c-di-GMP-specific phosphodiesterase class I)
MPIEEVFAYFTRNQTSSAADASPLHENDDGVIEGFFRGMRLNSVYQPLLDASTQHPLAHEALLRVHDDTGRGAMAPAAAFTVPKSADEAVYFDRLCRILHTLNFVRQAPPESDLFLNVSGRHLLGITDGGHGEIFERLLHMCGTQPHQIILEVLEAGVDDLAKLNEAVNAYRTRGYRVAIDDFGCEHSNFDRLWRLTPDIVKLDRSLILQGIDNPRARRILPKIVDIIHDLGAQVVCEGIETPDQHHLALDAGADYLQGYLYARPSPLLNQRCDAINAPVEEAIHA